MKLVLSLVLGLILIAGASAADRASADGFAAAAIMQISKGNVEQGKDFLYKALANDADCTDAVFELAKIFDKENNASALDFYLRSVALMNKDKKPTDKARLAEAERRVKALNTFAPRFNQAVEEYAADLDSIVKRANEPATRDVAMARVHDMDLISVLPAEKVPKFYASVAAEKEAREKKQTTPEVERELRALGWTTVKGLFIKKGNGIYESTEGRLEANRQNGRIEFTLHKHDGGGSVYATARSEFGSNNNSGEEGGDKGRGRDRNNRDRFGDFFRRPRDMSVEGYGIVASMKEVKSYGIDEANRFGSKDPYLLGTKQLPEAPKHMFVVAAMENNIDLYADNAREAKVSSGKVSQKGPFVLDVNGTVVIEAPRFTAQ